MVGNDNVSVLQDENQRAFLRYLPKRIAAFERRIQRYRNQGWEAAGMAVLSGDLQRLADASARYDLVEPRQQLLLLAQMVSGYVASASPPDAWQCEGMLAILSALTRSVVSGREHQVPSAPIGLAKEPLPAAASKTTALSAIDNSTARRLYCLSNGNPVVLQIGRRLEAEGYEVESVANVDELSELLMCVLPQVLLVDASHMSDLTAVGVLRSDMQQRSQPPQRILMVAMAARGNPDSRRAAHVAGVDLLLYPPHHSTEIVHHLQALLTQTIRDKVRVLIVEDDRGAALFAQSVLTNAGMQAQVEHDPLHVLESLNAFNPDLVLMDLHMPHANGVEVTMVIRDHPAFTRLPIVFLSGENDPDSRQEAIHAGGDDFLLKPVAPRHLIAVVEDRVRRMIVINEHGRGARA